ncbi:MAG: PA14 domain-containing protein, partial [Candidatus Zixiibacteriota bacterium]
VSMTTPNPGAKIYFTIDGTEPSVKSAAYVEPITLSSTSTVKARAIKPGSDDHFVTSVTYRQLVPHEATSVTDLKPGLAATYYEGEWQKLPSFDSVKVIQDFIADSIALPKIAREEDFGLTFSGYFLAPNDGLYEFAISSDDGSRVYIGDSLVVDNDGLHGGGDVIGRIALKAGYHPLYIPMFQCKGGRELDVHISGPDLPRERLRLNRLYYSAKSGK